MSRAGLRHWISRLAAVGVAVVVVCAAYLVFLAPVLQARSERAQRLAQMEDQAATLKALVAERAEWTRRHDSLSKGVVEAGIFVESGDPAIAQARTLSAASELAYAQGLQITTTEARPSETKDGLLRLPIVLQLLGSDEQLGKFLAAVEVYRPALVVDRLALRPADGGMASGQMLQAELTIVSLARTAP